MDIRIPYTVWVKVIKSNNVKSVNTSLEWHLKIDNLKNRPQYWHQQRPSKDLITDAVDSDESETQQLKTSNITLAKTNTEISESVSTKDTGCIETIYCLNSNCFNIEKEKEDSRYKLDKGYKSRGKKKNQLLSVSFIYKGKVSLQITFPRELSQRW